METIKKTLRKIEADSHRINTMRNLIKSCRDKGYSFCVRNGNNDYSLSFTSEQNERLLKALELTLKEEEEALRPITEKMKLIEELIAK